MHSVRAFELIPWFESRGMIQVPPCEYGSFDIKNQMNHFFAVCTAVKDVFKRELGGQRERIMVTHSRKYI